MPSASLGDPPHARGAPWRLAAALQRAGQGCIAGLLYDGALFIFCPLLTLLLCWGFKAPAFQQDVRVLDTEVSLAVLIGMTLTQGHLLVTAARSHLNPAVRRRHPLRLLLVPLALAALVSASELAFAACFVLMIFWDVYHSSLQTFGLGRIYDAKAGNDSRAGRRLDIGLNLVLYAGPVLAGAKLMQHADAFEEFEGLADVRVGAWIVHPSRVADVTPWMADHAGPLRALVLVVGFAYLAYYVVASRRLRRDGYRMPWTKACLLVSTATVSLLAWGYNTLGMAFLIMNIFHAVQYFALVWWTEREPLRRLFRLGPGSLPRALLLLGFLALPLAGGLLLYAADGRAVRVALMCCALLHFWFDGFIWSVRRQEHLQVG